MIPVVFPSWVLINVLLSMSIFLILYFDRGSAFDFEPVSILVDCDSTLALNFDLGFVSDHDDALQSDFSPTLYLDFGYLVEGIEWKEIGKKPEPRRERAPPAPPPPAAPNSGHDINKLRAPSKKLHFNLEMQFLLVRSKTLTHLVNFRVHKQAVLFGKQTVKIIEILKGDEFCNGPPYIAMNTNDINAVRRVIEIDRHVTYHENWASSGISTT
ncbi:hypothetical protein EVAR_60511_1 [Eumeta japonica]|uniref:Uncharacterized protein n=1 Tax=Eumeta variegata TaxID=151549 RepID=A0A4C1ZMT3_EUMVA|nr:hypothetical protein EVAR_60511_1 [Eumeta japonica]